MNNVPPSQHIYALIEQYASHDVLSVTANYEELDIIAYELGRLGIWMVSRDGASWWRNEERYLSPAVVLGSTLEQALKTRKAGL